VQPFTPEESEDRLYHLVSEYLRRDNLQALPASHRSLMTLVLRKLLASSTFAIAGALETLSRRLRGKLQQAKEAQDLEEELNEDFEVLDELAEEWGEEDMTPESLSTSERTALAREIEDLESFRALAVSITHNAKGAALLTALQTAFAKAEGLGAARKAIVFTESRRTQDYLLRVLADSPDEDSVVLFNGSNNDAKSREIYADWLGQHTDTERVTGS
jgi:ERCC4-related helicase